MWRESLGNDIKQQSYRLTGAVFCSGRRSAALRVFLRRQRAHIFRGNTAHGSFYAQMIPKAKAAKYYWAMVLGPLINAILSVRHRQTKPSSTKYRRKNLVIYKKFRYNWFRIYFSPGLGAERGVYQVRLSG